MNLAKFASIAAAAVLGLAAVGCAAEPGDDLEGGQPIEVTGTTSQALTCDASITAAAITKQIVSIDDPTKITVEIVTITSKPYKTMAIGMSFPAGFKRNSLTTTSCVEMSATSYKCRHEAVLESTGACTGTGSYSMTLMANADAGSGCGYGGDKRVDFNLTTENFCSETVVTTAGHAAVVYTDGNYGGSGFNLDEGYYNVAALAPLGNDALSSLRVAPGWKVTLYEHGYFSGRTKVFTADAPFVGSDFNDLTSSIAVTRQ